MGVEPSSLEGTVERVVYANEETAWSVVRLDVTGHPGGVTIVGSLAGVQPGEALRLTGRWVHDRRYGEQFQVESFVTVTPATLVGIERYLASGLVQGIGAVMAARLVAHFGLETLEVIDRAPERLTEVPGIGAVRCARIRAAWEEQRALRDVMVFLQAHGVSSAHAVRIYRAYGTRAVATVRENPYRLVVDAPGIGFKTADQIALRLGVEHGAPERAAAGVLHLLGVYAGEGHVYAPRPQLVARAAALLEIATEVVETAIAALADTAQVVLEPMDDDPAVYLARLHVAETRVAAGLAALLAHAPATPAVDLARVYGAFEAARGITLAAAQREAIRRALASPLLIVTGGPGTGKTTLVNGILAALDGAGLTVRLAAPTGRAAKRLAVTTGREATTIHRLLEFSPQTMAFERWAERPLEAELVVVDEASMVDTVLFGHLVDALPAGCRLILVGDVDQLPSVGAGAVLGDVIRSGVADVVRLEEIFRQAAESRIVVNAHRVRRGEPLLAGDADEAGDFFFLERREPDAILATIKQLLGERIPARFGLDPLADVQLLTPMRKGRLGVHQLNTELQALLNPQGATLTRGGRTFRIGDKVMQLRNDYDRDVFNGDIGRVAGVEPDDGRLVVRFEGREVGYETRDLDALTLAYACSIHKGQGSEYPGVVIPLHTEHYVMLQRNLLYTAITRGRRLVVLVGSARAVAIAIGTARVARRCSRLAERLQAAVDGAVQVDDGTLEPVLEPGAP